MVNAILNELVTVDVQGLFSYLARQKKNGKKSMHEYEEDVIRQSPNWARRPADVCRPALFHRLCQTAGLLMQKT